MMLNHHIKVAVRGIRKQGIYALLNIFGLSIGLVLGLFVILLVRHELSYDTSYQDGQRIYRLATKGELGNNIINTATSPMPLADLLESMEQVEEVVRFIPGANNVVKYQDKQFSEDGFYFADSDFFTLFNLELIERHPSIEISAPRQVVLTESSANKYFGDKKVLGEFIEREGMDYQVVGVCQDLPSATHFNVGFVASLNTIDEILLNKGDSVYVKNWKNDWLYLNCYTYLKLKDNVDSNEFIEEVNQRKDALLLPKVREVMEDESAADDIQMSFFTQKIRDIHFGSHLDGEINPNSKPIYVRLFVFVAVFVLFTTCVNFINLTTAKLRVKYQEVGYRQLIGATHSQLMMQFLVETLVYGLGAMFIGMVLLELLLPFFNSFFELNLEFDFFHGWIDFFGILIVLLVFALLAGSFPAFFFSMRKPGRLISGDYKIGKSGFVVRGLLVTSQFAVAMFLVIVATAMWWQINFVRTSDHGFDSADILVIERGHAVRNDLEAFKSDLKTIKGVRYVSACNSLPGDDYYQAAFKLNDGTSDQILMMPINYVDGDYYNTLGLRLKGGRFLSSDLGDSLGVVLNITAAKKLNLRKPLDEKIEVFGKSDLSLNTVGVVKDYHFESYFSEIKPLALMLMPDKMHFEYILIKQQDGEKIDLAGVKSVWNKYSDGAPFVYTNLNDRMNGLYEDDVRIAKIMSVFAVLSLFIALLGVIALVTFIIEYKSASIDVKNVLGASRQSVMRQVFSMYGIYVVVGVTLASLPAFYAIKVWGSSYAYYSFIGLGAFLAWAITLMLLSFVATFVQAFRGVSLRPVNS